MKSFPKSLENVLTVPLQEFYVMSFSEYMFIFVNIILIRRQWYSLLCFNNYSKIKRQEAIGQCFLDILSTKYLHSERLNPDTINYI